MLRADRQGVNRLNTRDSLTRVNGTETLVTPGGDSLLINNRNGGIQIMAPGARVDVLNLRTGQYERTTPPPSGFG